MSVLLIKRKLSNLERELVGEIDSLNSEYNSNEISISNYNAYQTLIQEKENTLKKIRKILVNIK